MVPRGIDLFCGAGGLALGFQAARCRIEAAVDVDEVANDTFRRSFAILQPEARPRVLSGPDYDLERLDLNLVADQAPDILINSLDRLSSAETRRIRVSLDAGSERCIIFSDTGPGIPAQLFERAFEPQFLIKESGRGKGLTIARRIVEALGGHIYVTLDGRRRGANIRITLPRKRSRATFHDAR